jgi:hypothetical protein
MKPRTVLYCWTWLSGPGWPERVRKYIDYYRTIQSELGFDEFVLADNASPIELIAPFEAPDTSIYRFDTELRLGGLSNEYPYVWRGFYLIKELMPFFDKIIICDSDSFITSQRLANYIRDNNSGFYTMWSELCGYPASEISVLNRDSFPMILEWMETPWETRAKPGHRFETEVPYTRVCKEFIGDRYGFYGDPTSEVDFYTQAKTEKVMTYRTNSLKLPIIGEI